MNTKSSLNIFALFIAVIILVGAGCQSSSSIADCKRTPWDSCVNSDGIDSALTGDWILESETISKGGQSFTTPLHGRVTSFGYRAVTEAANDSGFIDQRGTFSEDFNTETGIDTTVNSIQTTCEVIGVNAGDYFIDVSTDDPLAPNQAVEINDLVLYIQPTGGSQGLTCESGNDSITSTGTSTPLGNSFATSNGIPYRYEMSLDKRTLTLKNRNPVDVLITYIFKRN